MERQNGHIYEFADFRLIPAEGLLLRNGEAVPMKPKVFSTLVLLVENHGHLVEKTELIDRVWEGAFVEEAAVSRCIWAIRNALGEDSKDQKFIQTVPKRGYRFVGEVTTINGDRDLKLVEPINPEQQAVLTATNVLPLSRPTGNSAGLALAPEAIIEPDAAFPSAHIDESRPNLRSVPATVSAGPRRLLAYYVAAVLAVVAAGSFGVYQYLTANSSTAGSGQKRLAVLPLKPINVESRDPIFEFAIAESLILKLSSTNNLSVRPLATVRKYVELDRDPVDAGKELRVDLVLSSNYQIVNGNIRVTSQLWNVQTGQTEATFKSESDAADAFRMQDAVANEIGNAVSARFGNESAIFTANRGTANEEAYRLYLQGKYLVGKVTVPDARRAAEIFESAILADPNYAHAWAGKAAAYCTEAHMGGSVPEVAFAKAKPAIQKALELDPNVADVHAVLGIISFDYDWDFALSERHFSRAFELEPQHDTARRWYAVRLAMLGRYDEALTQIRTGIDINPNSVFHQFDYARILYNARRYDEAIEQLHRVREMDPSLGWAPTLTWTAYHLNGNYQEAYTWFIKQQESRKTDPAEIEAYKKVYENSGWLAVLKKFSEVLQAQYNPDGYDPKASPILLASSLIGDKDVAFKFANEGVRNRALWVPYLLTDPAFEILHGDPRYDEIVRRNGFPTVP
jgi:DNA-binding winged helix-turn-helix (wHTH) protein/tetratricopeptide (TPR) repeat protein